MDLMGNQEHHPLISYFTLIPLSYPETLHIPRGFAIISSLAQPSLSWSITTHNQLAVLHHTHSHHTTIQAWDNIGHSSTHHPNYPKLRCIYNHQQHQQQQHLAPSLNFHQSPTSHDHSTITKTERKTTISYLPDAERHGL